MNDSISRQAAIDAVSNWLYDGDDKRSVDQLLSALPSAQPEQRWIPVTERMPEYDDEYLVTKKCFGWNCKEYYEPDIARYEKRDGWHKSDEVLAWMPLPEPYQAERREA